MPQWSTIVLLYNSLNKTTTATTTTTKSWPWTMSWAVLNIFTRCLTDFIHLKEQ